MNIAMKRVNSNLCLSLQGVNMEAMGGPTSMCSIPVHSAASTMAQWGLQFGTLKAESPGWWWQQVTHHGEAI